MSYPCLKCKKPVQAYGCRFCDACYYPGIDEEYNEYQALMAEGYRHEDAAVRSGYMGAEELEGES